jgi:putative intracellular protease/amidase
MAIASHRPLMMILFRCVTPAAHFHMNANVLTPSATCAIALFEGCSALDVIGFRESIGETLASITLVGKDPVVKTNLGFIRFRADVNFASCAIPRILVLPGADKTIKNTRIDTGVLAWIKTAAEQTALIITIGNGADVLRAANASSMLGDRMIRPATGTEAAAMLSARLKRASASGPSLASYQDPSSVDGVWSTIQTYLNNQRPPYVC